MDSWIETLYDCKWKLIKIWAWLDHGNYQRCIDYSQCDIVVEFIGREGPNVTVTGKNGHIILDDWRCGTSAVFTPNVGWWVYELGLKSNSGINYRYQYRISSDSSELVINDYSYIAFSPVYKGFEYYFIKQ